ncbi:MAG: bet [Nevskia sp.]|nr:bet [Nevskia sp.]
MNALVKGEQTALANITEQELVEVLQSSLYPGAQLQSIKLVLGYCKASGLDPMQKPVHIVPMKVSTGQKDNNGWDIKAMRDVIMPGVGLYRTQAARTQEYAGVSDPEFGPTKTLSFKAERWEDDGGRRVKRWVDETIEYPEWCRVSVKRLVGGIVCDFPAREYWLENYASKGDSGEPNAMWKKRPIGQIAKCAEAQALRKAFPEQTGSQPTAEEMEGKDLMIEDQSGQPHAGKPAVAMPQAKAKPEAGEEGVTDVEPKVKPAAQDTGAASVGEIAYINKKIEAKGLTVAAARESAGLDASDTLDGLTKDGFVALKDALK